MPAEAKITSKMILEASIEVLRKVGNSGLNARSIAKELGCSTQPIYSVFSNMDALKKELYYEAQKAHKAKVAEYWGKTQPSNYKAYGMGYVKFAREEKELFRFLYMQKIDGIDNKQDINYEDIIKQIQADYNLDRKTAELFHGNMTIYTYGLAVLHNLGELNMTDKEISECLTTEFNALYKQFCGK